MKLPQGSRSPVVRQPRWYTRRLVRRPPDIRSRGPWAPKTPKVEDAIRVDAHELWEQADPRGSFDGGKRGMLQASESARYLPVAGGVLLKLIRGRRYFGTTKHRVTVGCPTCRRRGRYRYLYLTGDGPLPRCRKCCGLIYRSQARSQAARITKQIEKVSQWCASGKPENQAKAQAYWEGHWYRGVVWARIRGQRERQERRRRRAQTDAETAVWDAQQRQEQQAQREREREHRKHIRAVWRAYIDSLSSRRLKDRARAFRRVVRQFVRDQIPEGDPLRELMARRIEDLAALLPDFPDEVFDFDLDGGRVAGRRTGGAAWPV